MRQDLCPLTCLIIYLANYSLGEFSEKKKFDFGILRKEHDGGESADSAWKPKAPVREA